MVHRDFKHSLLDAQGRIPPPLRSEQSTAVHSYLPNNIKTAFLELLLLCCFALSEGQYWLQAATGKSRVTREALGHQLNVMAESRHLINFLHVDYDNIDVPRAPTAILTSQLMECIYYLCK